MSGSNNTGATYVRFIVAILGILVVALVSLVLFVVFAPKKAQVVAKAAGEKTGLARKPPPRAIVKATPTPVPTPSLPAVARKLRVPIENYPLKVVDNTTQEDGQMRLTLMVKNRSGIDWTTAYLTLSSGFHPYKAQYRLDNWKQGESRTIVYVFPSREYQARVRELRVEDVSKIPTAPEMLERMGVKVSDKATSGPGMTRAWRSLKSALHVPAPPVEDLVIAAAQGEPGKVNALIQSGTMSVNLEGLGTVDATPVDIDSSDGEILKAAAACNKAIQAASMEVTSIRALGDLLSSESWDNVMMKEGKGAAALQAIRAQDQQFMNQAIAVQSLHSKRNQPETARMVERLDRISQVVLQHRQALERQVQTAHPGFSLAE